MKKVFIAKAGDKVCNECDNFKNCVHSEQHGGAKHNGAKACKQFYPNNKPCETVKEDI